MICEEVDTMCNLSRKTVAVADDAQHLIQMCIYLSVPVLFIFLSLSSATDIYYGSIYYSRISLLNNIYLIRRLN